MKWLKRAAVGLAICIAMLTALSIWAVRSESGARSLAALARGAFGDRLELGAVEGTLAGPLMLAGIRYRDPAAGIALAAGRVDVDVAWSHLLRRIVHVRMLVLTGLDVSLHEPTQPRPQQDSHRVSPGRVSLKAPIDVVIDALRLSNARIRRGRTAILEVPEAMIAGRWTAQELSIERLGIETTQGRVNFAASVRFEPGMNGAGAPGLAEVLEGKGGGSFQWHAGGRTYAGSLQLLAVDERADLLVELNAPLTARLDLSLGQREELPWKFSLAVPGFDPREQVLSGTRWQSLAAALNGQGTLAQGNVSGRLVIDDQSLQIDHLGFVRRQETIELNGLMRSGAAAGEIRLSARLQRGQEGLRANADVQWRDLVIPALWAGQDLHTFGQLAIHASIAGSSGSYAATGNLSAGPSGRMADIALRVTGSPQSMRLEQFEIVQDSARLAASAEIELQPRIGWNIHAQAWQFDPGVFLAAWRGSLTFSLDSEGRMLDDGPHGSMRLAGLRGHLRGRRLAGEADLRLLRQRVVAGSLLLKSGDSQLRFHGRRGESMDAAVALDVASMSDLIPDSHGELTARASLRGRWPEMSIKGNAHGHGILAANLRLDSLQLEVDLENPLNPRGSASAQLAGLAVAAWRFDRLVARASGLPGAYQLELDARGEPLGARLALHGSRSSQGWSGSLEALTIDVKEVARLRLREPVHIAYGKSEIEVSQACLADGEIELCAGARLQAGGELQADYSLRSVPLALAGLLLPADLPVSIAGTIEGRGEVRRTTQGMLFGEASISSPAGRIARSSERATGPGEVLLSYDDLRIAASVAGAEAHASLAARLDGTGSLNGELVLAGPGHAGLGQPSTTIEGRASASIPSLAPLEVFVPQLANVQGHAEVNGVIRGTLQEPLITARLDARELAASVPAIGLYLSNGRLQATPDAAGGLQFSGAVESGEGRLDFDGHGSIDGTVELRIRGERFLVADVPGAHVVAAPDLNFTRAAGRMTLSGEVDIPQATVDLQNLPRSERTSRASRDVVVLDDPAVQDQAGSVPLHADVTVTLGPDIELAGFGLEAKATGRLAVREVPGEPTVGSGQLDVAGTFRAYDREMTLQRGRLLYAASPLDDPTLDLVATREVGELTVGLSVAGTARTPEVSIFSDPPMSQADALSYLLAGRPLDSITAWGDDDEGDVMEAAVRSLGNALGGLLAQNVGQHLGIDALEVRDDAMVGGSVLTIGRYLSPRLYLSYGVGLFEPGEIVTLRYRMRRGLVVQAQRGPEHSRVGVELRFER